MSKNIFNDKWLWFLVGYALVGSLAFALIFGPSYGGCGVIVGAYVAGVVRHKKVFWIRRSK